MRNKSRKGRKSLIFFLSFLAILFFLLDLGGYLGFLREQVDIVTNPIRYWTTTQSRRITTFIKDISSISSMRDENIFLKEKVLDLEEELSEKQELARENEVLREQLSIAEIGEFVLVKAVLIGGDLRTGSAISVVLDKGARDFIEEGQVVVYKGHMVGVIQEVFQRSSVVLLMESKDLSVPVISETNRTKGLVVGDVESGIKMTKILREEMVDIEEKILTSGIGGYPKGLIIGKVESIVGEDADVEKVALIKDYIDVQNIEEVFVLIDEES